MSVSTIGHIRVSPGIHYGAPRTLWQEQVALTKARRQLAEEQLALLRDEYVEKATIGPQLRNLSLHQRATLQRKLEQELGPRLSGLTTLEIMEQMKQATDEICQIFREGIAGWLSAPPETESTTSLPDQPPQLGQEESDPDPEPNPVTKAAGM